MKRLFSFFFAILFLAAPLLLQARPAGMQSRILSLINDYRHDNGRQELRSNALLNDLAQQHSERMAQGRVRFGHDGFDGRMKKALRGIKGAYGFAENVAYGTLSASEVVDMWTNSRGHRKNILGPYQLTGIGVARGRDGQLYFTQVFVSIRG